METRYLYRERIFRANGFRERRRIKRSPVPSSSRVDGSGVDGTVTGVPPNSNEPDWVWNFTGNWARSTPVDSKFPELVESASSKEVVDPDCRPLLMGPPLQLFPAQMQMLIFLKPPGKFPGSDKPVKTVEDPWYLEERDGEEVMPRERIDAWKEEAVVLSTVTFKRSCDAVRLLTVKVPVAERLVEIPVTLAGSSQLMV